MGHDLNISSSKITPVLSNGCAWCIFSAQKYANGASLQNVHKGASLKPQCNVKNVILGKIPH